MAYIYEVFNGEEALSVGNYTLYEDFETASEVLKVNILMALPSRI